jgi:hypothetical protein
MHRWLIIVSALGLPGCAPAGPSREFVTEPATNATSERPAHSQASSTMKPTPLQAAILRGTKPGGDLSHEIRELGDYTVSLRGDAEAICDALAKIEFAKSEQEAVSSNLDALTALFQDVDAPDSEGFLILREQGLTHLLRIVDASLQRPDANDGDLVFVLKILAMYGTHEGAKRVVAAARKPIDTDAYLWSIVLRQFSADHPERDYVLRELANPLPSGFLGMALLDTANQRALEGGRHRHPYDTDAGVERLKGWLSDRDEDHFSYAVSATAALPFLKHPRCRELFAIAEQHPDVQVRMESAWALAKCGDRAGIDRLAKLCLDPNHSARAQQYLEELGQEQAIPAAARDPDFQAKSEFARWLAHPNELGRPPDELEIVDRRQLKWPPDGTVMPLWLIRYTLRDDTGLENDDVECGVVGSRTFCFFSYELARRPPEDAYAIHCYWEMELADLIEEREVTESDDHAGLLTQWTGGSLESPQITTLVQLAPRLGYPQRQIALAEARLDGHAGWVVLDGPRSTWYPQADMPFETAKFTVHKVHLGRRLLGFSEAIDRQRFLQPATPSRTPQEIVLRYEELSTEAANAEPSRQTKLLTDYKSPVVRHFDRYVEAKAAAEGMPRSAALAAAYDRWLSIVKDAGPDVLREAVNGLSSILRNEFSPYVDALIETGRGSEIPALIERFAPHWEHNLGYGLLGRAAFKIKQFDRSEQYFTKLREGMEHYCRSENMSHLAEIWAQQGKQVQAKELLVDCLRKLQVLVKDSKHAMDREQYEGEYQFHRQTYMRLFPETAEQEFVQAGIPATMSAR